MIVFLTFLFMAISALMILVVLVQRGRGGGLAGAFGGGGGGGSAFGTKTGDVFTVVTVVLFVGFLLMAIWLNFLYPPPKNIPASGVTSGVTSSTTLPAVTPPVTTPVNTSPGGATTEPALKLPENTSNVIGVPPSNEPAKPSTESPAATLPKWETGRDAAVTICV